MSVLAILWFKWYERNQKKIEHIQNSSLSMLIAINSFVSFLLQKLPSKQWINSFNFTCPKSVVGRLTIKVVAANSTQIDSNSQEDSGVDDRVDVVIDE